MADSTKIDTFGVLLLAAGESARLGTSKQLLWFGGSTLLRRATEVATAVGAQATTVVLGARASRMREEILGLPCDVMINEHYEKGMAASITSGLRSMLANHPHLDGVLIMVCDQPFVNAAHLGKLLEVQRTAGVAIVASFYKGTKGVPALFHKVLFPELLQLKGDKGARKIIEKYQQETASVPFPLGDIDIDTPEMYEALLYQAGQGSGHKPGGGSDHRSTSRIN